MRKVELSKREANKEDKGQRLMKSAYELFVEKGIQNTSVSEIAKKAGIAKGTFYLYFKDKFDIEKKLVVKEASEIFEKAIGVVRETNETAFEKKVLIVMDYFIDYLKENPAILEFISKNLSYAFYIINNEDNRHQEIKNIYEQLYDTYLKSISDVSVEDLHVVLSLCIELMGSSIYSSIILEEPLPIDELRPHLHRMILAIFKEYAR